MRRWWLIVLVCLFSLPVWGGSKLKRGPGGNADLPTYSTAPDTCVAGLVGQQYYNTTRNETLTCKLITGTTYAWSAQNAPVGWVDVRDFGAVCDFVKGVDSYLPGSLTDDTDEIQAAIDAVKIDENIYGILLPSTLCYVTSTIQWWQGASFLGADDNQSGFACNQTDDDCLLARRTGTNILDHTFLQNLAVHKVGTCSNAPTELCVGGTLGCSSCDSKGEDYGNGVNWGSLAGGEGKSLDEVQVTGFPQFGVVLANGSVPFYAEDLTMFNNGLGAAATGTANCAAAACSSTQLVDTDITWSTSGDAPDWCSGCTGTGEHLGKWVRITGGTGAGQVRIITSHTADTLTINSAWDTDLVDDTSTYEIDAGGGMYIKGGGGSANSGCAVRNFSGDDNQGGLIVTGEGSQHAGADRCDFYNMKVEFSSDEEQKCGVRLLSGSMYVGIYGLNVIAGSTAAGTQAAICLEGDPREMELHGISIEESQIEYSLNAEWLDTAADRIQLNRLDSGYLPNDMNLRNSSSVPFACSAGWTGNRYYDNDLNEWCYCNGTDWKQMNDTSTTCS